MKTAMNTKMWQEFSARVASASSGCEGLRDFKISDSHPLEADATRNRAFRVFRFIAAFSLGTGIFSTHAATLTSDQTAFFENKIRPILVDNCYKCHSSKGEKLKGGLSVEFRDALLKGGENGPAIVPGDLGKSLLIKAVRYTDTDLQMPPKGKKLSDTQIADLETWVKMGAPDPRENSGAAAATDWGKNAKNHWAFQPIKKVAVPEVKNAEWLKQGSASAPGAVSRALAGNSESVATPTATEQTARARFAAPEAGALPQINPIDAFIFAKLQTNGMKPSEPADKRTLIRRATFDLIGLPPTVEEVKAFLDDNSPKAFEKVVDRLLASPQYGERWGRYWLDIARYSDTKGDVKKNKESPFYPYAWTYRDYVIRAFNSDKPFNQFILEQIAADRLPMDKERSSLAALGFITLGDHFNGNENDIINDRIDVVSKGFLGLTVTCARCHDHKFDPIPQKDYYSLRGVFASSVEPMDLPVIGNFTTTPEYAEFAKEYNQMVQKMAALEVERRAARKSGGKKVRKELQRDEIEVRRDISKLEMTHPGAPVKAMAIYDSTKPKDSPVFIRGEAENKGEIAPRRFLEVLSGPNRPVFRNGSGRLDLAYAIANPYNPLTARVAVNRIWQHHFGEGFVTTPDDFGTRSEPPSHPELLDYLAATFINEGWSMKKMHRLIMLSKTYQQSSESNPRYAQTDPQNRLLWRANIQRLEFEAVRDSMLAIGGKLDLTMYGRPVNLGEQPYSTRRTIYGYVDRRNLPEVYNQFDFANPDIESGKRYETTVPQQALFMMNSPLVVEQARNVTELPEFRALRDEKARIAFLYERIFQREPTAVETQLAMQFVKESPAPEKISAESRQDLRREKQKQKGKTGPAMSLANIPASELRKIGAWEKLAHALLQTNEALYIN